MKFAYKVIKNKNKSRTVEKNDAPVINPKIGNSTGTVSFIQVAKNTLGFRECAAIVNIANKTNCTVKLRQARSQALQKVFCRWLVSELSPIKAWS